MVAAKIIDGRPQLSIVDIATDKVERIIKTSGSAALPAWSHDGSRIAYAFIDTGNPGEINAITVDGKHDITLTKQPRHTTARANPVLLG